MKFLLSFLFIACSFIGKAQSDAGELRQVSSFEDLTNSGSAEVIVKFGDQKVYVDGPENLVTNYETKVENGNLKLGFRKNFIHRGIGKIKVTVYTKQLDDVNCSGSGSVKIADKIVFKHDTNIKVSGSGSVLVENASFNELDLGVSGSGSIKMSGTAKKLDAHISGSGAINAEGLSADYVEARCSGSGKLRITANKELDASITGSGNIYYSGNASVKRAAITGSGKLQKAG